MTTVIVLINHTKIAWSWYAITDGHVRRKVKPMKAISYSHYSREN